MLANCRKINYIRCSSTYRLDLMQITEEKIRQISEEALCHLGPNANPEMLKKVVKEVVRRLTPDTPSRGDDSKGDKNSLMTRSE